MDIDLIFKIAAIGIIVVLLMIVRQIGNLFETIKEVFGLY